MFTHTNQHGPVFTGLILNAQYYFILSLTANMVIGPDLTPGFDKCTKWYVYCQVSGFNSSHTKLKPSYFHQALSISLYKLDLS